MKRQKTLLNFFSKSQNKDNDSDDFCTPDPQKKCIITREPMVAIEERKKRKTTQDGSKNYCPGNFQASYARKFADWIVIKRDANNQVMEVTCNCCCCFKKQADALSKFFFGYKDPFKKETFKIHERSVSYRNCEQLYKAQKDSEDTPLA